MSTKILCVDDDANILAAYQRNLRKQFTLDTAVGGAEGLAAMDANGPYAVVVADMQMPGMNGVEFLKKAEEKSPDTVRIMLTGNADQKTAMDAVNQGHVFRFLNKPCPPESFAQTLTAGLQQYRLITAERELLEKTLNGSVKLLTDILSMIDPQAFGHGQTLQDSMRTFVKAFKLQSNWELEMAAMLCQIGRVTVPPAVLQKARSDLIMTGAEKDMLLRIPEMGATLLANVPRLEEVSRIVRYQKKNFDGSGFPSDGVTGEDIPIGARILKVLSDLAQLEISGIPKAKALEQMQNRVGYYDPRVLDTAFASFDIYLSKTTNGKASSKAIRLKELEVGQVVVSNIETSEGMLIIPAGTKISQTVLEKVRNFGSLGGLKEPIHVEA